MPFGRFARAHFTLTHATHQTMPTSTTHAIARPIATGSSSTNSANEIINASTPQSVISASGEVAR